MPQMERRDRLRKLVAEREAADLGGLPSMGAIEVVEEEKLQTEVFYTEGTDELLSARKGIAQWSLRRAAARTSAAKRRKTDEGGLQVCGWCGVTDVGRDVKVDWVGQGHARHVSMATSVQPSGVLGIGSTVQVIITSSTP